MARFACDAGLLATVRPLLLPLVSDTRHGHVAVETLAGIDRHRICV
jgi:hypothetical protein